MVILNKSINLKILKDSKPLTKKKGNIYLIILKKLYMGSRKASVKEIDKINILQASLLAMKRVTKKLKRKTYKGL